MAKILRGILRNASNVASEFRLIEREGVIWDQGEGIIAYPFWRGGAQKGGASSQTMNMR